MANLLFRGLRTLVLLLLLNISAAFAAGDMIIIKDASQLPADAIPAYEHILSFDARARFNPDGSMEMRENIKVLSLGRQIRRGIFRTLPLTWNRQDGKIFRVYYAIESVSRDGVPEPFSLDEAEKNLTVRIGSGERVLKPGIYNYEIRYQISNHFSRFPEWDELYWNVTGNDWAWPISKASFSLALPDSTANLNADAKDARLRSIDVYTGVAGAKEHNAQVLPDGSVRTLRPLARGEGLTVVYTWPRYPCRRSGAGGRFAAGASPYPHPKNLRGLATSAADGRLLPDVVAKKRHQSRAKNAAGRCALFAASRHVSGLPAFYHPA